MLDNVSTIPYGLETLTTRELDARLLNNMINRVSDFGIEYTLGCLMDEFIAQIENGFRLGMCWKNYGVKWELDHIIPVSYAKKEEFHAFLA